MESEALSWGIVHRGFVHDDHRARDLAATVIVVGNEDLQAAFLGGGGAAPGEIGAVHLFHVVRHRHVVGRVGAESAGVFVAVLRLLAELEPDTAEPVRLRGDSGSPLPCCGLKAEKGREDNGAPRHDESYFSSGKTSSSTSLSSYRFCSSRNFAKRAFLRSAMAGSAARSFISCGSSVRWNSFATLASG